MAAGTVVEVESVGPVAQHFGDEGVGGAEDGLRNCVFVVLSLEFSEVHIKYSQIRSEIATISERRYDGYKR